MEYLAPVINHVHNKLNVHLTLKLNYVKYSVPANATTKMDFDIMSKATGSECVDLYNAINAGYIAVDVLMLKDGEYVKIGEYEILKETANPTVRTVIRNPKKAEDIAKHLGVSVKKSDDTVVKTDTKIESVTKVESVKKPALDPVKAINNPRPRKSVDIAAKKDEHKTALDTVKENTEKDK